VDGLQGRYKEALGWLRDARTGDVRGVLNHPEMPGRSIDLIYGDSKGGLRHIDENHAGDADRLPEAFANLPVKTEGPTRTILQDDRARAVIPKDIKGEPKDWLLTYMRLGSRPDGKSIDGAAVKGSTLTSSNRPANPSIGAFLPTSNAPPWANWVPFTLVPHAALRPWSRDDDKTVP
jgi:hypothetical protein